LNVEVILSMRWVTAIDNGVVRRAHRSRAGSALRFIGQELCIPIYFEKGTVVPQK